MNKKNITNQILGNHIFDGSKYYINHLQKLHFRYLRDPIVKEDWWMLQPAKIYKRNHPQWNHHVFQKLAPHHHHCLWKLFGQHFGNQWKVVTIVDHPSAVEKSDINCHFILNTQWKNILVEKMKLKENQHNHNRYDRDHDHSSPSRWS